MRWETRASCRVSSSSPRASKPAITKFLLSFFYAGLYYETLEHLSIFSCLTNGYPLWITHCSIVFTKETVNTVLVLRAFLGVTWLSRVLLVFGDSKENTKEINSTFFVNKLFVFWIGWDVNFWSESSGDSGACNCKSVGKSKDFFKRNKNSN